MLIKDKLKHTGISCEKYNYTFDEAIEDPGNNPALVQLSNNEEELIITNYIEINNW